ncbi:YetF domain-containing protein [Clostridium peptidivorans]|uniref:YetF domain-containing protein n=1 Tax=Clostridium peptidivorans TaxID=100174 RepID=UPI000BE29E95|nr:DUF421 domain-containing protein [Clostridium peptidivorans]
MFIVLIRTIILYFIVIIAMRIMGKKQIGQLEPFELAITIMISELASLPMQDTEIPLIHGVIPIITLITLQASLVILQLKSEKLRNIVNGKPSILIESGQIDIKELKHQKFNINDLMEELRLQGFYDIEDIQYAILETSGQLSIIPKTDSTPATKKDMNIKAKQDSLPITLILDGKINYENLRLIKMNENKLLSKLKSSGVSSVDEVFIALINSKGEFYYQKRK